LAKGVGLRPGLLHQREAKFASIDWDIDSDASQQYPVMAVSYSQLAALYRKLQFAEL